MCIRDRPYRNYKDRYSKPETVIALSPMRVLTGVRPVEQLKTLAAAFGAAWLAERAELSPKQLLTEIIRLPEETASAAVQHLVDTAPGLLGASNDVVALSLIHISVEGAESRLRFRPLPICRAPSARI